MRTWSSKNFEQNRILAFLFIFLKFFMIFSHIFDSFRIISIRFVSVRFDSMRIKFGSFTMYESELNNVKTEPNQETI